MTLPSIPNWAARSVFALAVLSAPLGNAQTEITIQGQRGYPIALQRLQGPAGATATEIVKRDLQRAGIFQFQNQPQGAFVAQGGATPVRLDGVLIAPDGKRILQEAYQGNNLERLAHRYADDIVRVITGKPGIANSQVIFVSNKSGRKELYLCDYDGGNVRQLTRDNSISVSPSISPDGRTVAYTGYLGGYADIYVIDLPSGKRNRIINQPGTNSGADISPSGNQIALTMSYTGNPELYTAPISGGKGRRLTRTRGVESSPAWSPDGKSIVYVSNESGGPQLYIIGARGGKARLISTGHRYCTEPDWSPDGQRLCFSIRDGGRIKVAIHDFQNRVTRVLTSGSNAENPTWGADSRHLIYTQNNQIYLHDVQSGQRETIVSGMGQIGELAWTQ